MAEKAQTHTHILASVGVMSIWYNDEALTTRDNKGETPHDIALRSGACAKIKDLLSLTPEEASSLGGKEMRRLYAPVSHWRSEMTLWIKSRSYADCHKFIDEHDEELVREVLKYMNSILLRYVACHSQVYNDSLMFLTLRMIHRHPPSLTATDQGYSPLQIAKQPEFNACQEVINVLSLEPSYITSTPFPTLLLQFLPTTYHDIHGTYNTVCQFLRLTVAPQDKASLVVFKVLDLDHNFSVSRSAHAALSILYDLNHNMSLGYAVVSQVLSFLKPFPK